MIDNADQHPSRRAVLGAGGLTVAGLIATDLVTAPPAAAGPNDQARPILRPFPRTGQQVPAVGLGTFMTFDSLPGDDTRRIEEVTRRFWRGGGRVIDTSPLYGRAEVNLGRFLRGVADRAFLMNKIWSTGDFLWDDSHAEASLRRSMERLTRDRPLDIVACHNLVNVDVIVPLLHAWKAEGRIRHLSVTHHDPAYFDLLVRWIETGDLDAIQVHYSVHTRIAEERVLGAAADRGTAVFVNMPLEKGRLPAITEGKPLPGFAAELGITSWPELYLKWVIAHPAVTAVLPATSNPDHLTENLRALRGPLPDPEQRRRLVAELSELDGFAELAGMPWYPGRNYRGLVSRGQQRIRDRSPWWPS
ncbi:aldo/keto reductase [Microlunatus parietis]|uniref:Aryl-alcohol dehydrogenase-like predicted oxidoreductase n=1 Tax=Microlunatus parietis TaxID=682979 RepID=A0A7Y9LDF1_9ACTN|nr:aldo/keto reductase [Microlunatus parietis]NYE73832.1 aryl-alcohol dehydrogenase-like predicted oxidoreductase [Microlunatus parietis]